MAAPSPVGRGECIHWGTNAFSLPQPSEVDTDTEEYKSQNNTETDLEFEEHEGAIMLKESLDLQVSGQQTWSLGDLAILSRKEIFSPSSLGCRKRLLGCGLWNHSLVFCAALPWSCSLTIPFICSWMMPNPVGMRITLSSWL